MNTETPAFDESPPERGASTSYLREYQPRPDPTPAEIQQLEQDVLSRTNTVPDPRRLEVQRAEQIRRSPLVERRPACAGEYAVFLTTRKKVIDSYTPPPLRADGDPAPPISHTEDEAIYAKAVRYSKKADLQKDCLNCAGENCALKKLVPPKPAYDRIHKRVKLEKGDSEKVRPFDTLIPLLRGKSREHIPTPLLRLLDKRQAEIADEDSRKYSPTGVYEEDF